MTDTLKTMSEAAWQSSVIAHAQAAGFMVYFIPDAMWRRAFKSGIPQKLGNRGFCDLVLVGRGRVLMIELKRHGGRLSEHQIAWADALIDAGADYDVWFPQDLDTKVIPVLYHDHVTEEQDRYMSALRRRKSTQE